MGFDNREEVGVHAFMASVLAHTTVPVMFIPLHKPMLEKATKEHYGVGTNDFTVTRFLIPRLQDTGWALFCDAADMVCTSDLAELWALRDDSKSVMVVKHEYESRHPLKYLGTSMQADNSHYDRKNWASMMLINCDKPHPGNVHNMSKMDLLQLRSYLDCEIGELPKEWNWLADEYGPNPDAKLIHWTAGIPGFPHYQYAPMASEWFAAHAKANYAVN